MIDREASRRSSSAHQWLASLAGEFDLNLIVVARHDQQLNVRRSAMNCRASSWPRSLPCDGIHAAASRQRRKKKKEIIE